MPKDNDKPKQVDSGGDKSRSLDAIVNKLRHGCILRSKRWSGDIFSDYASGEIDEDATDDVMDEAADRLVLLQRNLRWYERRCKLLQREQAR